ncbi:Glycosyltransferase involved in cell wall bisynthesis [Pedobacter sp. ok626]|uniref:glycosyltransferase family 4 protein n=1 Tax=Pedobacter sp. ok626 TaxID=1761882 RepID=UPI000888C85D|nr:glycosyltransferase family 1 protein [Pedobacter sp. ok626]SDJ32393.1 Glycosyltransferase involved in cell wall bisynthesis [Pedobacter sp. ok626]
MSRIGINLLYINPKLAGGSVTYALKLIKEISRLDSTNEYVIYLNKDCKDFDFEVGSNFSVRVLNFGYSSVYRRYLWEQIILPYYVFIDKIDLLHSLGYVTPIVSTAKKIVSILDINYKGHENNMSKHKRFLLGFMVELSAKVSKKIITISEFSKRQIVLHTNTKPNKIVVTLLSGSSDVINNQYEPSELIFKRYNIKLPYIIAFSSPSPHKNIPKLIDAFEVISNKIPDLSLVLVGHRHKSENLKQIIDEKKLGNKVLFTGFVPDQDVEPLISNAKTFVFPSLYEGFGIPLLDAQVCKVPVASSNAGSLPEVGGDAVRYFNPNKSEEIAEVLLSILENEMISTKLIEAGLENRRRFSWSQTAKQTLDVYKEYLN